MRFSISPEPRQEFRMRTVSIDQILSACERGSGSRPSLEHYFSPTKKEAFIKEFLHYLNTRLLDARHGELDSDQYLVFVLMFQFVAPLLHIPAEKEFGTFFRILQESYGIENADLNLHFALKGYSGDMKREKDALEALRNELGESYEGHRDVKESVRKRLRNDALASISEWQHERSVATLAEAFGRSIVIPSFFSFTDKRLIQYYRATSEGITYRIPVPEEIEKSNETDDDL
jgi:hypothetical protein